MLFSVATKAGRQAMLASPQTWGFASPYPSLDSLHPSSCSSRFPSRQCRVQRNRVQLSENQMARGENSSGWSRTICSYERSVRSASASAWKPSVGFDFATAVSAASISPRLRSWRRVRAASLPCRFMTPTYSLKAYSLRSGKHRPWWPTRRRHRNEVR
jgi:hypothetical protein